jgi:hypothetical protein
MIKSKIIKLRYNKIVAMRELNWKEIEFFFFFFFFLANVGFCRGSQGGFFIKFFDLMHVF